MRDVTQIHLVTRLFSILLTHSSMDGSMAAVVLDHNEIGAAMSDDQLHVLMTSVWGKSFGKTSFVSKSKQVSQKPSVNFINILRTAFAAIFLDKKITKPNCN
jgi:hypothetical protein